jgi:hypothetical protein
VITVRWTPGPDDVRRAFRAARRSAPFRLLIFVLPKRAVGDTDAVRSLLAAHLGVR